MNTRIKLIIAVVSICLLFISITCSSPTEPPSELEPGRRDYVWTVDTLKIPFNFLSRISGTGTDDVWAVGSGGSLSTTIWHYNGTFWSTDNVSRGFVPRVIFSFNKYNVWSAGTEGKIWHYNGMWNKSFEFKKNGWYIGFEDIWGDEPTNLYAVGYTDSSDTRKAIIVHYDGKSWKEKKIPEFPYAFIRIKKDIKGNGKYYLLGNSFTDSGFLTSIFEYNGEDNIIQIYEAPFGIQTGAIIQLINKKMLFVIGNKINKYENGQFNPIFQINEPNFRGQIWGRNEKDIFLLMLDGIAHYNGTDVAYIYKNDHNPSISDAVVFEKDVFFVAADFNNDLNLMIRGTLK
jgi:hypothetical protein